MSERNDRYRAEGVRTSYRQTDAALTGWKRTGELAFLSEASSVPLQQTLRHQHTAFGNFFAGRARDPRSRSRTGRQIAHCTCSAFRMRDGVLTLAKTGTPLRFVWSFGGVDLAVPEPTTVVVSREPDGRWYLAFAVDSTEPVPAEPAGHAIGVGLGLTDLAVTSDGERIANPRHLVGRARNLARYQ